LNALRTKRLQSVLSYSKFRIKYQNDNATER
jgi:hypothetical protein